MRLIWFDFLILIFIFLFFFRIWWLSRSPRLAQSVKGPPWPPPLPPAVIGLRESRSGEYSPHVIKFNRVSFCFLLSFVAIRRDDIVSTGLWVVVLFFFRFLFCDVFVSRFAMATHSMKMTNTLIEKQSRQDGHCPSWFVELVKITEDLHSFSFCFQRQAKGRRRARDGSERSDVGRKANSWCHCPLWTSTEDSFDGRRVFFFAIFRQKRVALKGSSSFRSLYLLSLRWIDYQQNWGNQINKNTPKFDLEAVDRDQHSFMRLPLVLDWVLVGNCNIVWCRFWLDFDYLIASSLYHSRSTRNSRQDWVSSYFFSFLIEIFSILSKVTSK